VRSRRPQIIGAMQYVGVLCIEFFVLDDGALVVNEMAPRPHNSGHYTIDACVTSQFEQQARAMARLPLGDTRQHSPSVMLNILGDVWYEGDTDTQREPAWDQVLALPVRTCTCMARRSTPWPQDGPCHLHRCHAGDAQRQLAAACAILGITL
jgi:5-(carboxyamino)imidazole ribonucleotide synthase